VEFLCSALLDCVCARGRAVRCFPRAGDNDPLDVCEIGFKSATVGAVYPVRGS
jgi:hypothetical protein